MKALLAFIVVEMMILTCVIWACVNVWVEIKTPPMWSGTVDTVTVVKRGALHRIQADVRDGYDTLHIGNLRITYPDSILIDSVCISGVPIYVNSTTADTLIFNQY